MKKRVKITTFRWILDMIFPCYCRECGKIGTSFCERCILYNIKENPPFFARCDRDFRGIYACGMRTGVLSEMIIEYKFLSRRSYATVLSKMIDITLRRMMGEVKYSREKFIVVPLPTVQKHIRSRGFDHMRYLAEEFGKISGFEVRAILERRNSSVQVGSSAEMRRKQAKEAYEIRDRTKISGSEHYLLIDDVWTTGASMRAAAEVLCNRLAQLGIKKSEIKISAIVLAKNDGYEFS